ncbi:hypothetical protein A3C23_03330 [Candidatus Roizmanbacteria bacterium RIFCSPHIGHO2_02_FULL_37_13b]|uniref:Blue (type 1) copper domain-containing protein n=1 Tax=Candidatus Roizmanbacteria bacterium RIFCSPLOWO2_02_FULL_36_11 TaxID=1802071 RepID=A0A1F7JGG4_9BACT|nr:MAG: hypothetical protein A3C23_03330 [Candidatus Roizmanbacteria bacterium RIFCSPHIGHO2_02_FULL_37_13b]OGK54711.1 MAG: hypothetical protein A3H78_05450 [Candidatus Roizmanbacteria bacterium RIFCSPLOWO2_02_FULL_36_11]
MIGIVGLVLLIVVGGFAYMSSKGSQSVEETIIEQPVEDAATNETNTLPDESTPQVEVTNPVDQAVKEFTVDGSNFKFSVTEMNVKKGDTVKVIFNNTEGMHDFVIDEFNAKTKQLKTGESEAITFVVNQTGTFEYYCSVGKHRQMGMVGKLIVE